MMPSFIPVSLLIVYRPADSGDYELFMQKRTEDGPLNNLWEFPGGKIEPGETPEVAARREFAEEVGENTEKSVSCELFKMYKYDYPDRSVCLYAHIMRVKNQDFPVGKWFKLAPRFDEKSWSGVTLDANLEILKDLTNSFYEI